MELEINGVKADLGNATIAITKESIDIENPENRFISITNSINLPDTEINREIFNSPLKIESTNNSFDVLYKAKVIDQYVIFNGIGILTDGKKGVGYKFQLIDTSRGVFNQLETQINDFDWDSYDIFLDAASKAAIGMESLTHPFCWPEVCFHEKRVSTNLSLEYSRPSAYLSGILNLKLKNAGYDFTPSIKLASSLNHEDFLFTSYQKTLNYSIIGGNDLTGLDTNDFEHPDITTASNSVDFKAIKTRLRIRGVVEITGNETLYLVVRMYDPIVPNIEVQKFLISNSKNEIDIITADFQGTSTAMLVAVSIEGVGTVDFKNTLLYSLHSEKDRTDLNTNPFGDYKIKVKDNLPDMSFKDIYRTMCITTNSTHDIDTFSKSFTFKSFAGLKKLRSVDWSEKYIQDSENIDDDYGNLAKKNWLKHNNDLTVSSLLGSDYFNTNNENLEDEKDFLTLPFSASDEVVISAVSMVAVNVYGDTQRIQDQTINIRLYAVDLGVSSFLSWSQIKLLYAGLFDSLLRVRSVSCKMDLNKLDVLGFDLVQLVYIDYYSSNFIVLLINDFVSGTPTSVKLLRYG